jgi:putative phosphoribosyl transferase
LEYSRDFFKQVKPIQMNSFADLRSGGRVLAPSLEHFCISDDLMILGIVSGGAPVAEEVALKLNAPMDLIVIRRLLAPRGPGSILCAVNVAGTLVLDPELPPIPSEPETPLDHFLIGSIAELQQRANLCRGERDTVALSGRTIIIVDCGIRSGSSMQAAIAAVRTLSPRRIIAAAPVASNGASDMIQKLADDYVYCHSPPTFGHVGLWYKDFSRPADDRLSELIRDKNSSAR